MKQKFAILTRSLAAVCLTGFTAFWAGAQNDSVREMIAGEFAGVQVLSDDGAPGAAFSLRIRGVRSLRGDTQPLYVLDGVILNPATWDADKTFWSDPQDYQALQSTLDAINPADIEDIKILKDAAATALYGSMGGNGVVVITTKHGKALSRTAQWRSILKLNEKMRFSHSHHASVGGGAAKSTYYVSAGYSDENGTLKGSSLDVATVNAKFDQMVLKDGSFGVSLSFGMRNNDMVMATSPLGSNSAVKAAWDVHPVQYEDQAAWLSAYDDHSTQYSVSPGFHADIPIVAGLRFKAEGGLDFRNKTRYRWVGSALDRAAAIQGEAGQSNATLLRFNADASLAYNLSASGHKVDIYAGGGIYGNTFNEYIYEGQTFFSQDLRAPGISIAEKVAPYRHTSREALTTAVFAGASYSYRDRYFIGGSVRVEHLSKFDPKFVGGIFPSAYAAWDLAKEGFMESQNVLSTLKLRGAWGKSGSQEVLPYGYTPYYITGVAPEFTVDGLSNYYDLRWRNLGTQIDAGVDLGFLDDRIKASVNLYRNISTDNMEYYYHELKGEYESVYSNSASVRNMGVELSLDARVIDRESVQWSLGGNFSFNQNRVLSTGCEGDLMGTSVGVWNDGGLTATVNREGESVGSFYGYKSQGTVGKEHTLLTPMYQGGRQGIGDVKFIDITGDGNVTEEDLTVIGHPLPRFLAGFNTCLKVKGFTFRAALDGAFGFDVVNLRKFYSDPDVDMSACRGADVFSSRLVENASYVRLSNLSLSYDIPVDRVKFLQALTVFLQGGNLLTVTSYSGKAPYVNSYGFDITRPGFDNGAYPAYRSFLLGLTVRF